MITTAAITTGEMINGDHVLIIPKKEMQELSNILITFCEEHPRKKNAKKLSDQIGLLEMW